MSRPRQRAATAAATTSTRSATRTEERATPTLLRAFERDHVILFLLLYLSSHLVGAIKHPKNLSFASTMTVATLAAALGALFFALDYYQLHGLVHTHVPPASSRRASSSPTSGAPCCCSRPPAARTC